MPLYEYVCARCTQQFEEIVSASAATPKCPSCAEAGEVTRIAFGSGVMFGKKEDLRPPNIKSRLRPPRR
jgi:putative FmdB family regulatory protein